MNRPPTASGMQRPMSSRGMPGMGGPMAGMRPPSGFGGGVPGTAVGRPLASRRQGTAFGPQAGVGVALNTEISVANRPVTREGMTGMKRGKEGPGRQVLSASYFLGELRAKTSELNAEIANLNNEAEKIQRDSSQSSQMEKRHKTLMSEIAALKAQLSDYNLAIEKASLSVDLEQIEAERSELQNKNEREKRKVDQIFTERTNKEQKAREYEEKLRQQAQEFDEKLNMDPESRALYFSLREEGSQLKDEMMRRQRELDDITRKVEEMKQAFRGDPDKQRYLSLEEQKQQLQRKRDELMLQLETSNQSIPDEKTRLLNQAKAYRIDIDDLKRQEAEIKEQNERLKNAIAQAEMDIQEYKGDKSEKYEALLKKDKEMQDYIDKFDENKREAFENVSRIEENIVGLLEHISRSIAHEDNLPTVEGLNQLDADLQYKKKQADNSISTLEKLKQELELRRSELSKLETLDTKLGVELESLNEKIQSMESELKTYNNINQLRTVAQEKKMELEAKRARLIKQRESLKQHLHLLSAKEEALKRHHIRESETHSLLDGLEKKIQNLERNNYTLREYIQQKGSETDYSSIKADSIAMATELNAQICRFTTNS